MRKILAEVKKNLTLRDVAPLLGYLIIVLAGIVGLLVFTFHIFG